MFELQEHRYSDQVLLGAVGAAGKDVSRRFDDGLFLLDRRASDRSITRMDLVLLAALVARLRELLQREGMLLSDSALAQWFPTVVEFLTYARLSIVALLGLQTASRDNFMGTRYVPRDLMVTQLASQDNFIGARFISRDLLERAHGHSYWRIG